MEFSEPAPALELPPEEPLSDELMDQLIRRDNELGVMYEFQLDEAYATAQY